MIELQPFTAQQEWTVDEIPVLTAEISVPQPTSLNSNLARRIHRYYQLQCRSYLRYCETHLFPLAAQEYRAALAGSAPLPLFRAELGYQITYQDPHFLSLYTQSTQRGLHQTLHQRWGDTWDLVSGYPAPLSNFFPPRTAWKKQLLQTAAEEIQRQESSGISRYHEHWRKALRRSFNPQHYYLTEEGLVFFFPMYAIAPAVEGIPAFLIPYDQFAIPPQIPPMQ